MLKPHLSICNYAAGKSVRSTYLLNVGSCVPITMHPQWVASLRLPFHLLKPLFKISGVGPAETALDSRSGPGNS